MLRLARWLLLLAAAACPAKPADCPSPTGQNSPEVPLLERGVPYRARISGGSFSICEGTQVRLQASLLDEQQRSVDATWTLVDGDTKRPEAVLEFTPQSDGPFHYTVKLEPSLVMLQGDIVSGRRRPHAVEQRFTLPEGVACSDGVVTPSQTLLCIEPDAPALYAVREGSAAVSVDLPDDPIVAFARQTAWVSDGIEVSRWLEVDGGLLREPSDPLPERVTVLAATDNLGFGVQFAREVTRLGFDAGVWLPKVEIPVPRDISDSYSDVVEPSAAGSMSADGGYWWSSWGALCKNPVAEGQQQECFTLPFTHHTAEPDGVWFSGGGYGFHDADGGVVTTLGPRGADGVAPVLLEHGRAALIVREADGGLAYDFVDGGFSRGWVRGDRLFLSAPGEVTVLAR